MLYIRLFAVMIAIALVVGCSEKREVDTPAATLFLAASVGDLDRIRSLANKGNMIDEVDDHGRTPLVHAVMAHQIKAATLLIELGANPRYVTPKGYSLVMLSLYHTKSDAEEMFTSLIKLGLPVNTETPDGDSALNIAVDSHNWKMVKKIVSLGGCPNGKTVELLNKSAPPPPAGISEHLNSACRQASKQGR